MFSASPDSGRFVSQNRCLAVFLGPGKALSGVVSKPRIEVLVITVEVVIRAVFHQGRPIEIAFSDISKEDKVFRDGHAATA